MKYYFLYHYPWVLLISIVRNNILPMAAPLGQFISLMLMWFHQGLIESSDTYYSIPLKIKIIKIE
jgi:hypothetical protein